MSVLNISVCVSADASVHVCICVCARACVLARQHTQRDVHVGRLIGKAPCGRRPSQIAHNLVMGYNVMLCWCRYCSDIKLAA